VVTPSPSQSAAIGARLTPLLVVAGPGSGKTFCLIERIRFLIEQKGVAPERICAFTFTNKAAEEIADRLDQLGSRAALVKRSTIHKFCVEVLREFGKRVNVEPGFGIADDEYMYSVMWRLEANPRKHGKLAQLFTLHRLKGEELYDGNSRKLEKYLAILKENNLLDFDQLLVKTAELLLHVEEVAATVRRRYDAILVDEFQDLNRVQYAIVKALWQEHRNVFAVGDFNQSIYSWAGADLKVFNDYLNDFSPEQIALTDNFRCTPAVFDMARAFVNQNTPLFGAPVDAVARNTAQFAVEAWTFDDHDAEIAAIISDINAQREQHGLGWGDFALLYRRHEVGDVAEPGLLNARIPSRLAHGRAIAEDEIVAYVAAALRVIASPNDDHLKEAFLKEVLPQTLIHELRAEAESSSDLPINRARKRMWVRDEKGRKIRRGLYAIKNFGAISKRHNDLGALIEELLSQRVGEYRTPLEREHQLISDPELNVEASALAFRLNGAINHDRPVSVPALNGAGIALKAMLHDLGIRTVHIDHGAAQGAERITARDGGSLGLPIALFKAAQILASRKYEATFRDFTVVDIETTGKDRQTCEIVEIAAVRVRNGKQVAEWYTRVKPRVPIELGAYNTHHISEEDVKDAPYFEQIWPAFKDFCGRDVLVAHNGFAFDFPIIERMSKGLPDSGKLPTYDTLPLAKELEPASKKLEDLARSYGVPIGKAHAAIDDCRMLAGVFSRLADKQLARARKSAKVNLLDHLGVALVLSKGELEKIGVRITSDHSDDAGSGSSGGSSEPSLLFRIAQNYALSSYSQCLEYYGAIREELGDRTIPDVQQLIDALGGEEKMLRIRAEKSADERYPQAMMRLRRLLDSPEQRALRADPSPDARDDSLRKQIALFLETIALSMKDGTEVDRDRVNLLTLHSTKGLEFSRVYVVGVEDAQFLGEKASKAEIEESRRVLYVGMTRARERLVMTRVLQRGGRPTGGAQFLEEMGLIPETTSPSAVSGQQGPRRSLDPAPSG
jgi:superfamily I DNA/RNA helicase/DNA polymerase III epsilon subunit-like protein